MATQNTEQKVAGLRDLQNLGWESPESLPFELPATLKQVDCAFMTALLRHRGLLGPSSLFFAVCCLYVFVVCCVVGVVRVLCVCVCVCGV